MKIIVSIAWRNLWRNKRRSLVVISSISLGIFAMVLSMGLMNGMNRQMVENTISTSLGHIAVHRKGFQDTMKLEYHFLPSPEIIAAVGKEERVKAWAPRVKSQCMLRSSEASRGVMIVGIDPEREKKLTKIYEYTEKDNGSAFLAGPGDEAILISKSLAKRLDLLVGDRLVLLIQDREKEIVGVGMTVKGLFETPVDSFDKFVAFTGLENLQKISGLGKNVSEINILLHDKEDVDRVKAGIMKSLGDNTLEVLTWKDMAPSLVSAVRLFDSMMYIFFAIVFITVIFSVANTLIMAIMERFHEIGVMKSIGTRPAWIFSMVMMEAVSLAFVGLAAGLALGGAVTALLSMTGIDFSFYMESARTWGTGSVIYPAIKAMDIFMAMAIVLATAVIAALYPALKAARIKPLEALHYI